MKEQTCHFETLFSKDNNASGKKNFPAIIANCLFNERMTIVVLPIVTVSMERIA